jgi:hypothetical protein
MNAIRSLMPATAETAAQVQNSTTAGRRHWFSVRTPLLITLAVLVGIMGIVLSCPAVIDHALIAVF